MTTQRLCVSDSGDVTCDDHAGMYMRCAIEAKPNVKKHRTPLGNWAMYYTHLLGGENLVCETCVPWSSPDHPYNKIKAGA